MKKKNEKKDERLKKKHKKIDKDKCIMFYWKWVGFGGIEIGKSLKAKRKYEIDKRMGMGADEFMIPHSLFVFN